MIARHLLRDTGGATIVEFALLVPVILGTFLGVLQVGLAMQAQNALRNISADTSRYVVVEYQKEKTLTTTQVETKAKTIAAALPYALERSRFTATVTRPATQRVTDAIELEIKTTYSVRSVIPFLGMNEIPLTFTRPIFLIDNS